ncbi:PRC-barrel domain-containing protein [Martelella limonii]|uniref:PRC-barrel domain-containing protein n=1 Tax=Martelella limonii TaxID=1647649 RepID=UPI0015810179|nr:PRC-barrel domain-containing protein [Martelella limonii]
MLRKILSTTALVAVVSTGVAFADETKTADPVKQPEASATMENNGSMRVFPDRQAAGENAESFYGASDQQILASSLLGWPVYGLDAEDGEREQVGDINNIVMNTDGTANAAVIGVGGFLGMGEKAVAVSFDRLSWQPGAEGEGQWLSIDATKEELEAAPEFESDNENLMEAGSVPESETNQDQPNDLANTAGTALDQAGNATAETANDVANEDGMNSDASMTADTAENPMLEGMSEVDTATISYDDLEDAPVLGAEGDSVGEISDILAFGDNNENIFIVDVGGFLGIGEKPVAISADSTTIMSDGDSYVVKTMYDRETLENQPEYTEQSLNDNPDAVLLK